MANRKTRRLLLTGAGLGLLAALAVTLDYAWRVASIGVAYKAKMLCSGVFVAGRDAGEFLDDLEIDDLAILRHVDASIDRSAKSVTASGLGLIRRRAIYREGLGCALVLDDKAQHAVATGNPERLAQAETRIPAVPALQDVASGNVYRERLAPVLDRAFAEPNPLRQRRTQAVVIIHNGRIAGERYAGSIGPDTPLAGWSMTKSVVNALAGILVKEARLSVHRPAPIPEWRNPGDPRGHITLDHLLRMSSGLQFDEDVTSPRADVFHMLLGTADVATYATSKKLEAAPGTKWQYSSGTSNIIARILRTVLDNDHEYLTFPRRALFDRIGMTSAVLEADAAGTFVGSSFMYATARDWARFGMLYLQDGLWDGQRILPEGWVVYTRSPAPADPRRHYGAHFWLEVPDEYHAEADRLPADAFHAVGHEAQFVTIVPSAQAVIVRLGRTRYPDAWNHTAFVREVLAAAGSRNKPYASGQSIAPCKQLRKL